MESETESNCGGNEFFSGLLEVDELPLITGATLWGVGERTPCFLAFAYAWPIAKLGCS